MHRPRYTALTLVDSKRDRMFLVHFNGEKASVFMVFGVFADFVMLFLLKKALYCLLCFLNILFQ